MKTCSILLLVTCCNAQVLVSSKNPDDFGSVVAFQKQDVLGNHDYGYDEGHPSGATFRRESGDAFGNKIGSYGYKDANGNFRIVEYVADSGGFKANIISNEPGVAPQNPASVNINKPAFFPLVAPAVPVAPPPVIEPVAVPPPPPLPTVAVRQKVFPPPPMSFSYVSPVASPVAIPPPPPPVYFPPLTRITAPVGFSPVGKAAAAYPPPPPLPPPAYYTNLVPGKSYVSAVRSYPNAFPPLPAVPPQYNYLSYKSPPPYPGRLSFPL